MDNTKIGLLHRKNLTSSLVVHREIASDGVLLASADAPAPADFGIASVVLTWRAPNGKPMYVPPDMRIDGES